MKRTLGIGVVLTLVTAGLVSLSTRPRAPLSTSSLGDSLAQRVAPPEDEDEPGSAEAREGQQPAPRDSDCAARHHDTGRLGGGRTDCPRSRNLGQCWSRASTVWVSASRDRKARRTFATRRTTRSPSGPTTSCRSSTPRPPSSRRRAGSSIRPGACSTGRFRRRTSSRALVGSARRPTTATRSCATTSSPTAGSS